MRRIITLYLALEGLILIGFWVWVLCDRAAMAQLVLPGLAAALRMFMLADLGVLVASAFAAAWLAATSRPAARPVVWLHAGAAGYAGAAALGGWVEGALTPTAAAAMVPLVAGALAAALILWRREERA